MEVLAKRVVGLQEKKPKESKLKEQMWEPRMNCEAAVSSSEPYPYVVAEAEMQIKQSHSHEVCLDRSGECCSVTRLERIWSLSLHDLDAESDDKDRDEAVRELQRC